MNKIWIQVHSFPKYELEGRLDNINKKLQDLIQEFGPDANLEISASERWGDIEIDIEIHRLETDEEHYKRMQDKAVYDAKKLEQDRKLYEELKKKFGDK